MSMEKQTSDFLPATDWKRNLLQTFLRAAFCVYLISFLGHAVIAQTSTGEIAIRVTDTTSAVVPGANVSITGSNTGNLVRTLQTNGEGLAAAPLLLPGTYNITVSATGFKKSSRTGVLVNVGQTVDIRVQLEPGAAQETITVTGGTPLIEDKTSNLTQVISSHQMLELPLNGRSYLTVANLTAGAVPTVGTKDSSFNAYGNTGLQNAFLLDGERNVNYIRGLDNFQRDMVRPPLDAIAEFSVDTSNYSSEYGNSAGAVVNAITKSGTNQIHGSAYEFFQNYDMNAANYFSLAGNKPLSVQNQFGGSLGGPIRKDHAWLFGAYERLDNHTDIPYRSAVPTMANRSGDFGSTPVYDPFNTTQVNGQTVRQQFPNNIIPKGDMSPITSQLLNNFPQPNVPGSNDLFVYNAPQVSTSNNGVVRGDVQLTPKDSMFARGSWDYQSLLGAAALPLPTNTPVLRSIHNNGVGYGYTRTFSDTLVNEARFGYTAINLSSDATQKLNDIIPGAVTSYIDSSTPQFGMSGYPTIGAQAGCCSNSPLHKTSGVWDISDNISKVLGKHTLKFGGELLLIRTTTLAASQSRGSFNFTGVFTEDIQSRPKTGSSVADFLLGTANSVNLGSNLNSTEREWYGAGYLQDDWTFTRSLTLNLGLRYERMSAPIEVNNRLANLIVTQGDPNFGQYILAGDPRYPRSLVTQSNLDFSPRVGFAYRLPGVKDMVLRGSFGIFYAQDFGLGVGNTIAANPPFSNYGGLDIVSDQVNPSTGFLVVNGATIAPPPPVNPSTYKWIPSSTTTLQVFADQMTTPYVEEWNLTLEKQLPWELVWETSYVGNTGIHLWAVKQANQPLTNGPGSPNTRRPLSQYASGSLIETSPWGTSSYEGISTKLQKRWSNGVSFLAAFTHGRAIDFQDSAALGMCLGSQGCGGGDTPQNAYNLAPQRGPTDNDVAERFSMGGEWVLPFGRGNAYLQTGVPSIIAGGWALTGIYQDETGMPFTPTLSFDNANAGNPSWPNRVCNGNASNRTLNAWFDTKCFVAPPQYQFGNTGRNVLWGPGVDNLDLSVHRDFHPTENSVLEFRFEAFNSLNHPQFDRPGSVVATPTYGVITGTSQDARIIQLGLHATF
jgi:outer membrane receptor protein involved in Fe transport